MAALDKLPAEVRTAIVTARAKIPPSECLKLIDAGELADYVAAAVRQVDAVKCAEYRAAMASGAFNRKPEE
jgi:hypothetical protein